MAPRTAPKRNKKSDEKAKPQEDLTGLLKSTKLGKVHHKQRKKAKDNEEWVIDAWRQRGLIDMSIVSRVKFVGKAPA